jgi:hypothetical protein
MNFVTFMYAVILSNELVCILLHFAVFGRRLVDFKCI